MLCRLNTKNIGMNFIFVVSDGTKWKIGSNHSSVNIVTPQLKEVKQFTDNYCSIAA